MFFNLMKKVQMVSPDRALPDRDRVMPVPPQHFVNGAPMTPPFPDGMERALFGLGCFWGAERKFWETPGMWTTAVGYAGGYTANPTYEDVCTGRTGHNEVVLAVFDPATVSYDTLLKVFWETHDPTQGMRQGNDIGTQYRSGIYVYSEAQRRAAEASKARFAERSGKPATERSPPKSWTRRLSTTPRTTTSNIWPRCLTDIAASEGTGVSCPVGVAAAE